MIPVKERRTLLILNVLGAYILLQVCWWGYKLVDVNNQLYNAPGSGPMDHRALWMVIGEGSVFIVLLSLGFWRIRRYVIRELRFAQMQRTFLLAVTHELKTPVASVKLMLETLRSRDVPPEHSRKIIADALKETNRLEGLTGNILLATRLDHGVKEWSPGEADFSALLSIEAHRFRQLYLGKRDFRIDIEENAAVTGEQELLRALCFNLIDNAVKYTPEGGSISIVLRREEKNVRLELNDDGMGIPDNEKKRVFEKFYRPGNEATRRHKGTGLGLYIVHSTVKLHRGSVEIKDADGGGTTFVVLLPLSNAGR